MQLEIDNKSKWNTRLEQIKQAFLNGEFTYDGAIQKLYTSKVYYSLHGAKERVDAWKAEPRPTMVNQNTKRLPLLNEHVS